MRLVLFVAMIFLSGACSPAMTRRMNAVALITSTALLACDAGQTMRVAHADWSGGRTEANPLMGATPGEAMVAGYFVGAITLNGLAWLLTPERYRAALPVAITAVQADTVALNYRDGLGPCGI